jgi:DNA-directed RNA polymerase subunit RPC12/RpoP
VKADFEKGTKVCSRCGMELPVSEFNKDKSRSDGIYIQCKQCRSKYLSEYYKNNKEQIKTKSMEYQKTEKGKEVVKRANDKKRNTFGRVGHKRGCSGMLKRDYELMEEQLRRRNTQRKGNETRTKQIRTNAQGLLIWYDGKLDDITSEEYAKIMMREYRRQEYCAIRGYIARTKPSEHFLFDFDLEQMLKDNVYYGCGKNRIYIERWWDGTIRHWTVNDGIWKNKG